MLSHNLSHIQFITYTQSQSQFHDPNITIYHANLVNLFQNTNKLYKNISRNMGSKNPQTISHNHIKIICLETQRKTPIALNFINQFVFRH